MTFLSDYGRYLYFGKTQVSFSDFAVKINSVQSLALCMWVPCVSVAAADYDENLQYKRPESARK